MKHPNHINSTEAALLGHPDKVADAIGDAVLDEILRNDPYGRAGIQVLVTGLTVIVAGQIRTKIPVDIRRVVQDEISSIGYSDPTWGFTPNAVLVLDKLEQQTDELSINVEKGGAGDSACICGHACKDTHWLVPMGYHLAQSLAVAVDSARRNEDLRGIGPDGKIQVSIEYRDSKPVRLHSLILSLQNQGADALEKAHTYFREVIIPKVIPQELVDRKTLFHFRTGVGFTVGGPRADTGLSSRKVISDTYGAGRGWGGGGLSGKDPSKIDRWASYSARLLAKNIVAAGLCQSCDIMLGYAIGSQQPLAVDAVLDCPVDEDMEQRVNAQLRNQDLSPETMIKKLNLRRPIYRALSFGGHFGENASHHVWEQTGLLPELEM
jgi:S-adenosylmethionine synthetase